MVKKIRTFIPQKNKVRAELQKEINSTCPFCDNEDVGHFEIHHIDEIPSNNEPSNLLLLCPTCHSKITKNEIAKENVLKKKMNILPNTSEIRLISVSIDRKNCGWDYIKEIDMAYQFVNINKYPYPIINFSLINNSRKTVLMTNINIKSKILPIGLSGPAIPLPKVLKPSIKYELEIPEKGETSNVLLENEIEIPESRAFKFQAEFFCKYNEVSYPPLGKYILYLELYFNNDFKVMIPPILLNCKSDDEQLTHYGLG
ncbi:MAG: HNH endonuclease signature motif containing protein [bacterium]|nr:HNH endonuclease signature motif containing protein [bacterium]